MSGPFGTCKRKAFSSGGVIERGHHSQSGRCREVLFSPLPTISASWGFCIRGSSGRLPGKSLFVHDTPVTHQEEE